MFLRDDGKQMRFYVAWYPGDPIYPQYDDDCSMLVSPTSVAFRWKVRHLGITPQSLIVDSGGFRHTVVGASPSQRQIFERQLKMIDGVTCNVTLCQLDYPLVNAHLTSNERDRLIHQTLANAADFRGFAARYGLPNNVELMGIVQGYDLDSLVYSAHELKQMGYTRFGIGSLAFLFNNEQIADRIRAVQRVVGVGVHILGVTGERIAPTLHALGVRSIDSSRPAKAAMFNVIFSSDPFKRHRIPSTRGRYEQTTYIHEPFPCACPACEGRANPDLLKLGKREYVFLRTLHNYYHLKRAISTHADVARSV